MVNTRSVRAGNQAQPLGQGQGQGQLPNNLPPHLPPQIPNMFPPVDHAEGGDENQPHNSAHNSTSIANQDVVTTQLAAMQQYLEKTGSEQRGAPPPHHNTDSIPHPLNTNIKLEPYLVGFKIPQLETYDGMKDLDDHLHAFYSCMQAQNASNALMCKIFPSTLCVVKMTSSFNVVIERPTLTEIRVVVSQSHLCMKFPSPMGITTLREDETRATPVEDVEKVQIDDRDPNRKTQIGTRLNPKERAELIAFLRANKDVFAWTSTDMPGIPTSVSQHKLNTNPLKKPIAQKRCLFGGERLQVIKEKVEKLLQIGFIRRVDYCKWVANLMLVKKANVPTTPEDEEKTSFYASDEIYCYVMMPFDLKNVGATYQKMRGIEVNPEKITAIAKMEPPKSVKDIQRLTGNVATLHRFISKSVDKCLPFFKIMRSVAQKDGSSKQKKFEGKLHSMS
ncbi:hypothetical protein SLEP1_g22719 [Rubroshorea leprosula]|uniref:Reverse transcriptase domain-containing protein n=1 Tax=Rubroshorea leprosula TaxID=152421 RepID=A0AAV5JKZ0_9ROSI|nr:hypothetical protein SLEP1_g22719 [Rubroshorea leprosula]